MWLKSGIAMAMVQASSCSSNSTPSLGTSICRRYSHKKTKKEREGGRKGKERKKQFCSSWRGINDSDADENLFSLCLQESGDDEYQGDQSDTEDEVDSDFDIDEGDEPSSDGETEEPRRKRRVVTKAYKVKGGVLVFLGFLNSCSLFHQVSRSSHQSHFLQCWFSLPFTCFFSSLVSDSILSPGAS